jgi:hypothetical protein
VIEGEPDVSNSDEKESEAIRTYIERYRRAEDEVED